MTLQLVIPRDALIFRDGKPFTAVPGERAKSLPFPLPSTIAGAVRTRVGINPETGEFDKSRIEELRKIAVRGPVLVELAEHDRLNWYVPAPADAVIVAESNSPTRYALAPLQLGSEYYSDLTELALVGPAKPLKTKPLRHPPLYWKWEQMEAWLHAASEGPVNLRELGIHGPERETRTHVSIDPNLQAAATGALFQTSGIEFMRKGIKLSDTSNLALAIETDANITEGMGFLGGERRVVRWQTINAKLPPCPAPIRQKIIEDRHCRLILLTPAYFTEGYLPLWLKTHYHINTKAVALPRYQTLSGWDYALGRPKASRRLVPAGSVYFVEFGEGSDIERFVDTFWMNSVSDDAQLRTDGFGLTVFGTWDGRYREMNVEVRS